MRFSGVAQDHLGITIDSGQILEASEFIEQSKRRTGTTPLDNEFEFRERELSEILQSLEQSNIVILYGAAGVGKTKLALQAGSAFQKTHPDFQLYCIKSKALPIHNDIQTYLYGEQPFIVVVDDANLFEDSLDALLLLCEQKAHGTIKFILTVRSYLWKGIHQRTQSFRPASVQVSPLSDEEIKSIVKGCTFRIQGELALAQILTLAQGNPRLAIMAALAMSGQTQDFHYIQTNFDLYREYFSPILDEIRDRVGEAAIKVLGILAFWGALDKNDSAFLHTFYERFSVSEDEFWQILTQLDRLELIDMYQAEVARIDDQIFATYIFFIAFLDTNPEEFLYILDHPQLFDRVRHSIILHSMAFAFGHIARRQLLPSCRVHWQKIRQDESEALRFLQVFWFVEPSWTFAFVKHYTDSLSIEDCEINYTTNPAEISDDYIALLSNFSRWDGEAQKALKLLFNYFDKRPTLFHQVLHYITKEALYHEQNMDGNYALQTLLFNELKKKAEESPSSLQFRHLLLAAAPRFLATRHQSTSSTDPFNQYRITWSEFRLSLNDELRTLRYNVWQFVFEQWDRGLQQEVVKVLHQHTRWIDPKSNHLAYQEELPMVMQFIEQKLDTLNFRHCLLVHQYFSSLRRNSIDVCIYRNVKRKFQCREFKIYRAFLLDIERREWRMQYRQYTEYRKRKIERYFGKFQSIQEYQDLLADCQLIISQLEDNENKSQIEYKVHELFRDILLFLSQTNREMTFAVLQYICSTRNPLGLVPFDCIYTILQQDKETTDRLLNLIQTYQFARRDDWFWLFFKHIKEENIESRCLEVLLMFCDTFEQATVGFDFKWILKFRGLQSTILQEVLQRLLQRSKDTGISFGFEFLADETFWANMEEIVVSSPSLIRELYLYADTHNNHFDYDREFLSRIVAMQPHFLTEYAQTMFSKEEYVSRYDHHDYSKVWDLPNYGEIFEQVWKYFYQQYTSKSVWHWQLSDYVGIFFRSDSRQVDSQRMIDFLYRIIDRYPHDEAHLYLAFQIVGVNFLAKRYHVVRHYLSKQPRPEIFAKTIRFLKPGVYSGSGSLIPSFEEERIFWNTVLSLVQADVELLDYIEPVEQIVGEFDAWIKHEERRDFFKH